MQLDPSIAAIVVGASSGLGEATARALAAAGARVAVFDLNVEQGVAVANSIGGIFVKVDITSEESVDAGYDAARNAHGHERVLINCAGIVAGAKTISRDRATGHISPFPIDLFSRVVEVNLIGTFRCLVRSAAGMAALDPLAEGERGVIINTASIAATDGQIGQAAYAASKAAILGLNLPIARDLAPEGIRINAIMPGIIETPMMASMPEKVRENLASLVSFPRRLGKPSEFASLALELIRNPYLNGEAIRLDGALRMAGK